MKRNNIALVTLITVLNLFVVGADACTSFIVSGKATKDGRPILFKNRDTNDLNNYLHYFKGSKYDYIGDVNVNPKSPGVWFGYNTAGFAIMNTAAYNLNGFNDKNDENGQDGVVMQLALAQCTSLKDFENLLDSLPKPLNCNSNFGVIDAHGGCAYYETGNAGFVKFDVNDPKIAPLGYLVRTNFGYSGDRSLDKGISRFQEISGICLNLSGRNGFDISSALEIPRCLTHGLTGQSLSENLPSSSSDNHLVAFRDFIPRYLTASTGIIQGVLPNESPLLTVCWTIIGSPLTTVAVPVMISNVPKTPALLDKTDAHGSKLCNWGLELKKTLFPIQRGEGADYILLPKLINAQKTGILQQLAPLEKEIVDRGEAVIAECRKKGKPDDSLTLYYNWVDRYLTNAYASLFSLK
ncbi:MAG: carcinine hydrolase/isopenicillin-N N-acyltransferase family protein [Dysgonamonadaceae bacterium]